MSGTATPAPLRLLVTAIGGEGGGVLMNWIVEAARTAGWGVQATSVPGVAQRTGGTSYYVELAEPGTTPVFALMPMPGRVDVVLASELVEAARMLETGMVSPRTTMIASTSRTYTTAEKISLGDDRFDEETVKEAARAMAKSAHLLDLNALARDHGTFISATMFGALAGSGALPWPLETSRRILGNPDDPRAGPSLSGFDAAAAAVSGDAPAAPETPEAEPLPQVPEMARGFPDALARVIGHGHERLIDYQGAAYADSYLDRIGTLARDADLADPQTLHAVTEAARRLALWMAYEDIARVADLKTRPERFARIRREAELTGDQLLTVTDFMKPRAEEIADMLPASLGRRIMARVEAGKGFPFLDKGRYIRSNGALGYWMLRSVAAMRRWRPRSLRFQAEQAAIEEWLDAMRQALAADTAFAGALAELPRLRKGYSDTMQRGIRAYDRITEAVVRPALAAGPKAEDAAQLRRAISAALADENHAALDALLAGEAPPAPPVPDLRTQSRAAAAE